MSVIQIAVILFIAFLGLASAATVQIQVDTLTTAADKQYYCKAQKFSSAIGNTDDEFHITKVSGFSGTPGSVDYVQLWVCNDDYSEYAQKECGDALPSLKNCQLMYGWKQNVSDLVLPSDAGFKAGDGKDHDEMILVVKYNAFSVGPDTTGVTFTYQSSIRTYDAGIMATGPDPERVNIRSNTVNSKTIGAACPNDCATVDDWWYFSSIPYVRHASLTSFYTLYGKYSRAFAGATSNSDLVTTTFSNDVTQPHYEASWITICTFPADTVDRNYGNTDDDSACLMYFNFYPRKNGIKTCYDNICDNRSGNANYRGNIIINYVAICFAGGIIGVIIGITIHMIVLAILAWFEANTARFACKNIKYMINPLWWWREYKPHDEEEGDKKKDEEEEEKAGSDDDN